jgi:hypothetical protein
MCHSRDQRMGTEMLTQQSLVSLQPLAMPQELWVPRESGEGLARKEEPPVQAFPPSNA